MTTVEHRRDSHPQRIDVRCSAALESVRGGRCQLFAGHDGPHAIMFARCGERRVRLWRSCDPTATSDAEPAGLQRPWMFGYPVPAWFESEG